MFSAKKLEDLAQSVKKINQKLSYLEEKTEAIDKNIKESFGKINEKIDNLKQKNSETIASFEEQVKKIEDLSAKLKNRVNSLSTLTNNLGTNLLEETKENINKKFSFLESINAKYKTVSDDIAKCSNQIQSATEELQKFKKIAEHLKETDFTLSKYANKITKEDQEKLRLMHEIDRLKHLISKERRTRY